ncbi:putative drug exporter of the RND superfamily [Parafrankia irregularis]|uniref:Putative drug exporter of the RND superfamily n=1 Tax=Parafrankia irregularis TaxID=795642 RepID=A0A0S4QH61_9ACTN|nr:MULTISPECIES: MMPL family transporter [Parafrankia]MBE3199455.1 MMPL family transporter [Parafrankia sp. CH37]CUU53882.1 putative drug exporter of the RND superfamily [Parafrankia irregularis]
MSGFLYRVGRLAATRPWRVIGVWVVALVVATVLAAQLGGEPHDDFDAPGTASQRGTDLLRAEFPALAEAQARVVLHTRDGSPVATGLTDTVARRLADVPAVVVVSPPQVSADGDTAMFTLNYDRPVTDLGGSKAIDQLVDAVTPAAEAGLTTEFGGQVAENVQEVSGTAEAVGIAFALVILLIAFGSIIAAGVPLAVALIGLGIGSAGITLIAAGTDVSTIAPTLASMVGIGVGIDYALLLVTRHVEGLRNGLSVPEAAARANGTAGVSVLFAGVTVVLSLMGLRLVGLNTYVTTGFTTAAVVVTVVVTALTLVPALCGLAGTRLLGRRARAALNASAAAGAPVAMVQDTADRTAQPEPETKPNPHPQPQPQPRRTLTAAWAERVGRRPLPWATGALLLLLLLAAPILGMRTWPQDAGSQPDSTYQRRAYDLIAAEYGPGANGPLIVAVDLRRISATDLDGLVRRLAATPDVAAVAEPVVAPSGDAAVIIVTPTVGPSDERAAELVRTLRAEVLPAGVEITGLTAVYTDLSRWMSDRLWWVVGFVVGVSLLLLTLVFRSPVVALKAAVMNLLSIAAAYGVVTVVFQWGWGTDLLGLPHSVPMSSWLPVLMFTVLFGLSMDYEVFLLSRIREDYLATGDPHGSVVRGLASTGRVISSAALIMISVFAGFALDPDVTVKMVGFGMAVAVLVDATIIRMIMVPATMALLGRANWWLPGWLDRVLPHLDVHGSGPAAPSTPRPDSEPTADSLGLPAVGHTHLPLPRQQDPLAPLDETDQQQPDPIGR